MQQYIGSYQVKFYDMPIEFACCRHDLLNSDVSYYMVIHVVLLWHFPFCYTTFYHIMIMVYVIVWHRRLAPIFIAYDIMYVIPLYIRTGWSMLYCVVFFFTNYMVLYFTTQHGLILYDRMLWYII